MTLAVIAGVTTLFELLDSIRSLPLPVLQQVTLAGG